MRSVVRSVQSPHRGARGTVATALVASTALIAALLSSAPATAAPTSAAPSAADTPISIPSFSDVKSTVGKFRDGVYIVTLKEAPAASYTGTISGYAATKPKAGRQLSTESSSVKKYRSLLTSRQKSITAKLGIKPLYNYTVTSNGFAAQLTAVEAARLAKSSAVAHVTPDGVAKVQAESSLDYLKVSTAGGVWDSLGGVANAGKGVVVGVLDTGIAPENPSFAGDALGTTVSSNTPWKSGDTINFIKGDGSTFTNTPNIGNDHFTAGDLNTKLIGADYFVAGWGLQNIGTIDEGEYLSPRDGDGHGSHTASTAAGNNNVDAVVKSEAAGTSVDFGKISGVAPAAKIAAYKVCWTGPDPDSTDDEGCAFSDIVAAIDRATADGVDVISYSIGAGAAQTTYSDVDAAYLNAAAAGVFVSAAGGNDGPAASTLDNAAPWETTVAASTIPSYEATAVLGNGAKYAGASITVDRGMDPITGVVLVDAANVAVAGDAGEDARRCAPGSLDPTKVTGKVVLCDRGIYARTDKSQTVADAGGLGTILVNVPDGANDTDVDEHAIPTIHLSNAYYAALHAYAAPGTGSVSFVDGNTSAVTTPVPQIAGFSSHGPVEAAGEDVLKPDIAAPGVGILAAATNLERTPDYEFLSGTSMATPHISGLAALYLGAHPLASPMEIKSALMTTAGNTVSDTNKPVTDPFAQGAGEVRPSKYLNPGLLYLSDLNDWKGYLVGAGEANFTGVEGIDPSDLNQASIAIGDLFGTQTITRTVTAQRAGTYKATIKVPGVKTTVSPATLKFTAAGQSKSFTVKFTRTTAKLDQYATGFLTWKRTAGSTSVRSPIAVHPTSAKPPVSITGTGTGGSTTVSIKTGAKVTVPIEPDGLAEGVIATPKGEGENVYSDTAVTGGHARYVHEVAANTEIVRLNVAPLVEEGVDLDLYVFYYENEADIPGDISLEALVASGNLIALSATTAAAETVDIPSPPAGFYLSYVDYFLAPPAGAQFRETFYALNPATNVGNFTAIPTSVQGTTGGTSKYTLRWGGLAANRSFIGFVFYGDLDDYTSVYITSGNSLPPVVVAKPTISGTPLVGETLTVTKGEWDADVSTLDFTYQWLADGEAIAGATTNAYTVTPDDVGKKLSVIVSASLNGGKATRVVSTAGTAAIATTTSIEFVKNPVKTNENARVIATVMTESDQPITGTVTVRYGVKSTSVRTGTLTASDDGTVTVTLPKLTKKKMYTVTATYNGTIGLAASTSDTGTLRVR